MFTIFAVLFLGAAVHVAYEGPQGEVQTYVVQNTDAGATELLTLLEPLLSGATNRPLVCMSAAEGHSLEGPAFERAVFKENVRRLLFAQPRYLLDAKALGKSSADPKVLLQSCQSVLPKPRS